MAFQILRRPLVQSRTGLSRSTIYLKIAQGTFPKPISLGARAVGWLDTEIDEWLSNQIEVSRGTEELCISHLASSYLSEEPESGFRAPEIDTPVLGDRNS
jgi:prophage regulatory protein